MQEAPVHEALKPLSWLIGKWKSVKAEGTYPTIKPFAYVEELEFTSLGQPILNYTSRTWHPVKHTPMHLESGFLRIKPGTDTVAFLVAHNFGLTSVEEGRVVDQVVEVKSTKISRMEFAKDPQVIAIERVLKLNTRGQLEAVVSMATDNTSLTKHLDLVYVKCE